MKNKFTQRLIVVMASAILLFTTDSLSQCLPYLGQTPPGITPVKFAPNNSYLASSSWWWQSSPVFSPGGNEMYFVKYFSSTETHEIWYTKCVDGQWTIPQKASFSTSTFDGNPLFLESNDTLYYYSKRPEGFIFRVARTPTGWSEPVALNIPVPANFAGVTSFYVTINKTIYFSMLDTSNSSPNIWLTADIYRSEFVNGQFAQPEKIGSPINTNIGEGVEYVDNDERFMIYSSTKEGGYGYHDMYLSNRNGDGTWNNPINLGAQINSVSEDGSATITPDGKYFFFTTMKFRDQGYTPYWVDANVVTNLINDNTVTDVDGNVYKTVKIGTQVWMTENLRTTKYNDSLAIPNVSSDLSWGNLSTPGYCWGKFNISYRTRFGIWYNWYAVNTGNLAPKGWHVPTSAEWKTLRDFLGGESVAGGKMKVTGTDYWFSPNIGATNESGFSAYPVGYRNYDGVDFNLPGDLASFWASDEFDASSAIGTRLTADRQDFRVFDFGVSKTYGYSIRCLKNDPNTSVNEELSKPTRFNLLQNYPNPFNPSTMIKYELKTQSFVKLNIANILGEIVFEAINETQDAGIHELDFNADHLSSGIYFYQLVAGKYQAIKKMVLLR